MLGYNTVIWHTLVIAAGSNFAFKIAAKHLQIDMVTVESLQELIITLFNSTIADPLQSMI